MLKARYAIAMILACTAGCGSREVVLDDAPLNPAETAERDEARDRFMQMQTAIDEQRRQNMQRFAPPGQAPAPAQPAPGR